MSVIKKSFGFMPNGEEVFEFVMTNDTGVSISALNYGCILRTMQVPDRNGEMGDIVLGFDTLEGYLHSPHYIGAVVGRYANRIGNGKFSIQDKDYQLNINMPPHHLHGGFKGFDKTIWAATPVENEMGSGVTFHYVSPDGEEGFPGTLTVFIQYLLTNENALIINFVASSDAPTPVNLTQHSYFNLTGTTMPIAQHGLLVNSDFYLPVDATRLVTGILEPVEGTLFDFRKAKYIAASFQLDHPQIAITLGLDHCWVVNKSPDTLDFAASLYDPSSGRYLEIHTTEPGLQVYTGFSLSGKGKNHMELQAFSGVALETQHFPDSVNHPDFPSTLLLPGKTFTSITVFKFSTLN
jgi:aldose 1-epimerase